MLEGVTKESLLRLAEEAEPLKSQPPGSREHIKWSDRVEDLLRMTFGKDSKYYQSFTSIQWGAFGTKIIGGPSDPWASMNPGAALERERIRAFQQQLDGAQGLLEAAADALEREPPRRTSETAADASNSVLKVINLVERQLRKVIRNAPAREREIQDAVENLLIGAQIPYERESERIVYSSKTYTPDFTLNELDLALEVKLCPDADREKTMIAEINDDILAYKARHKNLVFVVYDLGFMRDVDRFVGSFEKHGDVVVRVIKH
jgi:hypothetical protein